MHENRGLTRPQRVPGVSSTYGPLPPSALTDALRRPSWASHVYSPLPVYAVCQRPCQWLCCASSHVLRLLCAMVRHMAWPLWPGPVCMCVVPHTGRVLVALCYGGVQNSPPYTGPYIPPGYSGLYTAPLYGGRAFWGSLRDNLQRPAPDVGFAKSKAQGKEVNHMDGAYYLRALVFIISCDSRERCVSCEK